MNSIPEVSAAIVTFLAFSAIALALHEAAHVAMAWALGIRVKRVGISWRGPFIVREAGEPRANIYIALAGPLMNLILAASFWALAPNFAFLNLALGLSNLLPIKGSDGLRIWIVSRQLRTNVESGETDSTSPEECGAFPRKAPGAVR